MPLIHMHIFALRKNKASDGFVEKTTKYPLVACYLAQRFPLNSAFCTPFVDKIVSNELGLARSL
jgi:hypothetical protein